MVKIVMVGAGSVVFCKNLTGDILSHPELKEATLCYMDIDRERLEVAEALCRKAARALEAKPRIQATCDLREALDGADFVINMAQVGGFDSTLVDFEIPRKYGLKFTIADTTGPGGLFRALRTYPMLTNLCRQMEELCPCAVLLNYSNPMGMNMQTITRTSGLRAVGLCHSVQGTLNQIMGYIGIDPKEVAFVCAGINHMAFYLKLEYQGEDLYPRLFEAMNDPTIYASNAVRFELMKRLGYFVTESSEHNAEYSPYFIPHGQESIDRYRVPIDEYLRRCDRIVEEFGRLKQICAGKQAVDFRRSHEYGSTIIHSIVTGNPSVVYGNMPNRGTISNLPADAIAEAATVVDRAGLRFTNVGALPPQLVGYIQPHVTQQELFIRAAIEGRRDHVYQAAMFDPLTSATLSLDQIVEMCDEMIAAHGCASEGGLLPDLCAKTTHASGCGRSFERVEASKLRSRWSELQRQSEAEYVRNWHVIGPFAAERGQCNGLSVRTEIERDFNRLHGAVDLEMAYQIGQREVQWKKATCAAKGYVDLRNALGPDEWCIAYAYAEFDSSEARQARLRCGSDDGIKIWLNGQVVHENETGRPYVMDDDATTIQLKAGTNRILVKVDNYMCDWGFGVAISAQSQSQ